MTTFYNKHVLDYLARESSAPNFPTFSDYDQRVDYNRYFKVMERKLFKEIFYMHRTTVQAKLQPFDSLTLVSTPYNLT